MTKLRSLLRPAAVLLATLAFATPAAATTYSTDYTDLWFNTGEQGWGVNVIQQGNTLFATLFVYGASGNPTWFVASDVEPSPAGSQTSFTGVLYQASGPFFGLGSFNPGAVGRQAVGAITFTFGSATTGTMQYTVNGNLFTKTITRQTWRYNDLTGNYVGGFTAQASNCGNGVTNGAVLVFDSLQVQQSGAQATLSLSYYNGAGAAVQCTFSGLYSQSGQLGSVAGDWGCAFSDNTPTTSGTYSITEIAASANGFNGKFSAVDNYCTYDGRFSGVRRAQ